MTPKQREWIDNASYEELLHHWRHADIGDELFLGECGEYYFLVLSAKKATLTHEQRVAASKRIGF